MSAAGPLVGVVMGSDSDWPTMSKAAEVLEKFGVSYEAKVVSAHRTPDLLTAYAKSAQERGLKCVIAGAGGAAHLPGMVAAMTTVPVLGVPVQSKALSGMDSLLSIVQMPKGIPVATFAIGEAGAGNAGLFAVAMLAGSDEELSAKLTAFREQQRDTVLGKVLLQSSRVRQGGSFVEVNEMKNIILPGSAIGVLGGGQLGRMLCLDARRMGYRTVVWSGVEARYAEPVQGVADVVINEPFDSESALKKFCDEVDVATVEFENIPVETMRAVAEHVPMRPSAESVAICQRRVAEKTFLREQEIPCAPFEVVNSLADLEKAYAEIGPEAVLKTAAFGYDGKGQVRLKKGADLVAAWEQLGGEQAVLEGFVDFECEVSVIIARREDGEVVLYPPAENQHRHHILDLSLVPARIRERSTEEAFEIAIRIAEAMDYVGLMAVEFFVQADGEVLVNEMAPRPHNSGHYTMDGCVTSQFEQQLRSICGLPLGSTELLNFTVMLNLLGDMWRGEPRTLQEEAIFETYGATLHLYGKTDPGERRKMGHVNLVGDETILEGIADLKATLLGE